MGFDTMMAQQPFWIAAAVVRFVNSLLIDDMGLMEFSVSFTCLVVPLDFNDTNLTCKTTKVETKNQRNDGILPTICQNKGENFARFP